MATMRRKKIEKSEKLAKLSPQFSKKFKITFFLIKIAPVWPQIKIMPPYSDRLTLPARNIQIM